MHRYGSEVLHFITGLGDQAVVLPFVLIVAVTLAAAGARREALYWCIAIFAALSTTLAAKLIFLPCGHLFPQLELRSPSGHAAAAIAAYGGFAVLWAKLVTGRLRLVLVSAAILGGLGIAMSRVLIGVHTVPEVVFGCFIGLIAPGILSLLERRETVATPKPSLLLLLVPPVLVALLHGTSLPIEQRIEGIALRIAAALGVCG